MMWCLGLSWLPWVFLWSAAQFTSGQNVVIQDIRLACGNSTAGRVEVRVRGAWGTVCDDNWDDEDATVVCRQLGLTGGEATTDSQPFGRGAGAIWLDNVNCTGNETNLNDCVFLTEDNCNHVEDAGVICQPAEDGTMVSPIITTPQTDAMQAYMCGPSLKDCTGDRDAIELTESSTGKYIHCYTKSSQVEWVIEKNGVDTVVARCASLDHTCAILDTSIISNGYWDRYESYIWTRGNATRPGSGGAGFSWSGYDVICRHVEGSGHSCPVDIIYPPSYSNISCSMSISSGLNLTVSCTVNKAYSSLNRYNCDVRQRGLSDLSQGRSSYSSGSSSDYVSGTCTTTFPMPTSPGTHSYYVIVYPGLKSVSASGSVTMTWPNDAPVIHCNDQKGYIPENKALTCMCSVCDLGQPQGRLLVYRDNVQLVSGDYGGSSVQFGENSISSADNSTVYKCVLDWATSDSQDNYTTFTLNVAYSPRLQEGTPEMSRYLNYKSGPIRREFPLTMYPAIQTWNLEYYGPVSNIGEGRPARADLYSVHCTDTPSSPLHLTTCALTITGATQDDKGLYVVALDNGVGQLFTFLFQLDVDGGGSLSESQSSESQSAPDVLYIAVAVGVTVAVFIIIILVFVVWMWRRRWTLPCGKTTGEPQNQNGRPVPEQICMDEGRSRAAPNLSDAMQAVPECHAPDSTYEPLQISDINKRSEYSSIFARSKARASDKEDNVYENAAAFAADSP